MERQQDKDMEESCKTMAQLMDQGLCRPEKEQVDR